MLQERLRDARNKQQKAHVKHSNKEVYNPEDLNEEDIADINHDDSIKDTGTEEEGKKPSHKLKSDEEITKQWEENMKGFVPEDFITFEIEEGKSMLLQEKILHTTPSKVRGSYYVVGGTAETIVSAAVLDENMRVIFKH